MDLYTLSKTHQVMLVFDCPLTSNKSYEQFSDSFYANLKKPVVIFSETEIPQSIKDSHQNLSKND